MADHSDHADHSDPAHIDRQVRIYILVFVTLMVLTMVTVAVSRLHLPIREAVTVALVVASIKGGLVASYFMHLISERKLIYWVLGFTVAFFFAVLVLPLWAHFQPIHN
jgi:cytochrome c oxidase subunit IV